MINLADMLWIEMRKATRSKMPWLTALGFMLVSLVGAFLMLFYKDPEFAREAGLISTKASLIGGSADWPTYLNMLAQAIAIGGIMLFNLIGGWVFGREYVDGTAKDLLLVPLPRATILADKFMVTAAWCALLTVMVYVVALGLGALVGLPQASPEVFLQGGATLAVTASLVFLALTPVVLCASVGRGYLLPMGAAMVALLFANVAGVIGWGDYLPWSVPAIYAGFSGEGTANLEAASFGIVILTGLAGIMGTYLWWWFADQNG